VKATAQYHAALKALFALKEQFHDAPNDDTRAMYRVIELVSSMLTDGMAILGYPALPSDWAEFERPAPSDNNKRGGAR
jgi:hypothetical protein